MRLGSAEVRQHIAFNLSVTDRMAAQLLKPGQNWRHLPADVLPDRFKKIRPYDATTIMKRLHADRPTYTITTKFNEASTGAFIHPDQPRTLSVREAARIQSFPDSFVFAGSPVQMRTQIGNAVPPLLAKAIAEAIRPEVLLDRGLVERPIRSTIRMDDVALSDIVGLQGARKRVKQHDNGATIPLSPPEARAK